MAMFAQFNRTTFFMEGVSFKQQLNPALAPSRGYVTVPFVGSINAGVSSNAISSEYFSDLLNSSKTADYFTTDKFINQLKDNNRLNMSLASDLAAAGWWYMQQRFLAQERQNALRLQESESRAASLEEQVRQLRDLQQQLQTRGNALETRVAESSAQQEQLQALYDDVARVRGDARLAEVERAITLANQHLAVSGNVKGALLALEGAEKQLADSEQSQAIGLRRVILQDIEKLKSLPEVDLVRSVARMDEVLSRVETLPFLGDQDAPAADAPGGLAMAPAATEEAAPEEEPAEAPVADEPTDDSLSGKFKRWYHDLLGAGSRAATAAHEEFTSLVKIRRIDEPDRYLLGPDQKRSIRQGLRLQLLSARINLLNRNEALFRQDLAKSVETIQRFFDVEKPEVKSSINLLTELQSEPLQLKLPTLSDSMAALAAARAESEKRF